LLAFCPASRGFGDMIELIRSIFRRLLHRKAPRKKRRAHVAAGRTSAQAIVNRLVAILDQRRDAATTVAKLQRLKATLPTGPWRSDVTDLMLGECRKAIERSVATIEFPSLETIYHILGFVTPSSTDYVRRVAGEVAIPILNRLYEHDRVEEAEALVHWMLVVYGHRISSEQEFSRYIESFSASATESGRRFGSSHAETTPRDEKGPLVIGFVTKGNSLSTMTLNHIYPICQALAQRDASDIRPIIYVVGGTPDTFTSPNPIRFLDTKPFGPGRARTLYTKLKEAMRADGVQIAFYIHAFDAAFFLFGMRLAPVQVLFSQYLHPKTPGADIEEFMTWGSPALRRQFFNGRDWRVVPSCLHEEPNREPSSVVDEIRRKLLAEHKVLLATFARTEKVNQSEFLAAVIEILKKHPDAVFAWAGELEHQSVVREFRAAGVIDQTRFIGWVDTKLYARAIDIFLDSFPLANGITALHAMAESKPVVSIFDSFSLVGRDVPPVFSDASDPPPSAQATISRLRTLFGGDGLMSILRCERVDQYVALASRMIVDRQFRQAAGGTFKSLHSLLYSNEHLMAEIFQDQVREIAEQHGLAMPATSLHKIDG
jgi:hypothetical protein